MIDEHGDWITPVGYLNLDEKQELLSRQSFALHACRIEAFGIAVAEMASLGCVPFIPDTGGAGEIVPFPELQFGEKEEAVSKILSILENPARIEELRFQLAEEVAKFGPSIFMKDLRDHVSRFISLHQSGDDHVPDATSGKSLSPTH